MLKGLSEEEVKILIPDRTFLLGYRGSIAHGTYQPQSEPTSIDDKDLLGVCVGPYSTYFGLKRWEQKETFYKEWDVVVYEIRKFVNMLLGCNPNVLSLLWIEPQHYVHNTHYGQRLISNRKIFVSKKAFHSFTGYAYGQLKRMTHFTFNGYMGEKRKKLVEKFGYDTKNAAHLIRLLRMGIEFLREGELHVLRPDAQDLLEIKRGVYTLEQIQSLAQDLFRRAELAYDESKLPNEPDEVAANQLVEEIVWEWWESK